MADSSDGSVTLSVKAEVADTITKIKNVEGALSSLEDKSKTFSAAAMASADVVKTQLNAELAALKERLTALTPVMEKGTGTTQKLTEEAQKLYDTNIVLERSLASIIATSQGAIAAWESLGAAQQAATQFNARVIDSNLGMYSSTKSAAASMAVFEQSLATTGVATTGLTAGLVGTEVAAGQIGKTLISTRAASEGVRGAMELMTGQAVYARREFTFMGINMLMAMGPMGFIVGGIVAVTAELGYLAYQSIVTSEAIEKIKLGADFAGNYAIGEEAIRSLRTEMTALPDVTAKVADEVIGSFARMHEVSAVELKGLSLAAQELAASTGTTIPAAQKVLEDVMDGEKLTVDKLTHTFRDLTAAQIEEILEAQRTGDTHTVLATIMDSLADSTKRTTAELAAQEASLFTVHNALAYFSDFMLITHGIAPAVDANTRLTNEYTAALDKQVESTRAAAAAERLHLDTLTEEILKKGLRAGAAEDTKGAGIDKAKADIADLKKAIDSLNSYSVGDNPMLQKLNEQLVQAQENLANLETQATNRSMEQLKLKEAAEKAYYKTVEDLVRANAAYFINLEKEEKDAEIAKIDAVKLANAELAKDETLSKDEVLQRQIQNWQILLAGTELSATNRFAVEQDLNRAIIALHKSEAAEIIQNDKNLARVEADLIEVNTALNNNSNQEITRQTRLRIQEMTRLDNERFANERANLQIMEGYEQQFINSVLSGRQGLATALMLLSGRIIEKEIADDLKYFTARIFYTNAELANIYKNGMAGLAFHLWGEKTKTEGTLAGTSARAGIEDAGFLSSMGKFLLNALAWITGDAAVAGAGATAQAAPYAGPAAPAIGALVENDVMAMSLGLPSLDTGTWNVPQDMTANIHKGEIVVPKPYADEMRAGGGGNTTIVIQALDSADVHRWVKSNSGALAKAVSDHQRFNPSTRGNF